uniref:Uncharacterized protein n=1 Tax=uncultured bacterium ws085G8 TaxID=1131825 RepID=I1X5C3_9BACT|nr:hypothetical protein ws085G8_0028 [uncultured bacterium ws085G8]
MNRVSKLGEDIARANETLLTELAFDALKSRTDIQFELQTSDDHRFLSIAQYLFSPLTPGHFR